MYGGINNAALFQQKRPARNKLSSMGGIMSSSPELIKSQVETNTPPAPPPNAMSGGVATPSMALMQQPMSTMPAPAPAPNPLPKPPSTPPINQTPAPNPNPMNVNKPKGFAPGGPVNAAPENAPSLMEVFKQGVGSGNIGQNPMAFGGGVAPAFVGLYELIKNMMPGSEEQAKEDLTKVTNANNGTTEEKTEAVTTITGQPNTEEGVKESYKIVTGKKAPERLSIDELDDRILKILIGGGLAQPGSLGARVAQSYAMGLAGKRETAMLRAGMGSGGSNTASQYATKQEIRFNDILKQTYAALLAEMQNPNDPEERKKVMNEALQVAAQAAPDSLSAQKLLAGQPVPPPDMTTTTTPDDTTTQAPSTSVPKLTPGQIVTQGGKRYKVDSNGIPQEIK